MRIVRHGVETLEILAIGFWGKLFAGLGPLMAGRQGIQSPVKEYSKTILDKP